MPTSIQDVADKAKVSISTVSRVLNSKSIVNVDTRKRVESAIEELDYRPNVFARGLMLNRSNILGLVLPDLHGEFYSEIIRGANQRARELGYQLMISSASKEHTGSKVLSNVSSHGMVDGIAVMVSEVDDSIRKNLSGVKIPLVVLDGEIDGIKHDSVVIDQRLGTIAMIRHLIHTRKARRIVFVGGLVTNIDTIERLQAFRDIMENCEHAIAERDIYHLDYSYQKAYELGCKHVRKWASHSASIFAANDEMAAGIIDAAIEAGIHVPKDLIVVGFDDTRIASMTRPRLTTVRMPMSSMGASAVELLCQRLDDRKRPPTKVSLQSELIIRESCQREE